MTEKNENRWSYLTSSEINALPPKVREYIMNLETIADPMCLVRDAAIQRENAEALVIKVAQLEQQLEAFGESTMRLLARAEAAEAALKRLGYGTEVIDVITDSGTSFISYVGDPSWDTVENRARVRSELASLRERVADARRTLTCPHRSDATRVSDALKILRGEKR